jgi:YesN/AraC family two-component response regulator
LTASNGAIALDLLTQKCGEIDLVFSDIVMPGRISGVDLAREIGERYPNIPVILASGYSVEAQKAARDGIIVLAKPYQVDELEVLFARIKAKKTPT